MLRLSRLGMLLCALLCLVAPPAMAQSEPANGPPPHLPRIHALVNAKIVIAPGVVLEKGTIVIRDGVIEYVGAEDLVPPEARLWDLNGKTVHAGFIDLSVPVKAPASLPPSPGLHWNSHVRAQFKALDAEPLDQGTIEALHKIGFTAAQIVPDRGIFRGTASTIALTGDGGGTPMVHQINGPQVVQFETGGWNSNEYPGSLIGAVALVRQTLIDAEWYGHCVEMYRINPIHIEPPAPSDALAALRYVVRQQQQPVLFNTESELDLIRAAHLRDEFDLNIMVLGSGEEFRRLGDVLESNLSIILPIDFPKAPQIEATEDADSIDLRTMMDWEQAPTNPRRLIQGGATVALTTANLKSRDKFLDNLRQAIKEGLTEDEALAALTTTPAKMLAIDKVMGRIEQGSVANLAIIEGTGELFGKDRTVTALWINGNRIEMKPTPPVNPLGTWSVTLNGENEPKFDLLITGKPESPELELQLSETKTKARATSWRVERLSFVLPGRLFDRAEWEQYSAVVQGATMRGVIRTASGEEITWTASRQPPKAENQAEAKPAQGEEIAKVDDQSGKPEDKKDKEEEYVKAPETYPTPLGAYGLMEPRPRPAVILVRNATVWTSAEAGILKNTDVLMRDGKISQIGKDLAAPPDAVVIDATGKHMSPGIIDAHSHTGIDRGSINEGTQAITAEVRISDAVDPDDINWYWQLAGGTTVVNQLHGSANPIGGQNNVVKIRWGLGPDRFHFEDSKPGIKFALGENVKQSNWGDNYTTRYPQSRMGVETLIRSAFLAARDYEQQWQRFDSGAATKQRLYPPRRDLELEALAEVLDGKRLVHCHSYRQDEILMLIRVADDFGFTIGTFQHVLEGYKVAGEIAAHGAGASCFSDWWAYKFEVYDAIPYDGAIMHDAGIVVSFNSDSDELARRLNTEAAKAVRYGGVDPAEALKFVTINPARQLAIDSRVGSIEVGKDADFVIWSGSPLSAFSRCEQTWIDGRQMFSLESDAALRQVAQSERQRLIQKILLKNLKDPTKEEKKDDADKNDDESKPDSDAEPDDDTPPRLGMLEGMRRDRELRGYDPLTSRPGECGCGDLH